MGTRKPKKSNKRFRRTRSKKQRGGDDGTDLLKASEKGDIKEVTRLLAKEGINVDTIDEVKSLGADSYVVCSVIAKSNDIEEKILELKKSEMVGAFKNIFA